MIYIYNMPSIFTHDHIFYILVIKYFKKITEESYIYIYNYRNIKIRISYRKQIRTINKNRIRMIKRTCSNYVQ